LSLALGSGATTAIVSVLNGLLFRTLPIAEPERLGVLSTSPDDSRGQTPGWSAATWQELQRHESIFDAVSAFAGARFATVVTGESEFADTLLVSGNYFPMLRVKPFLGRIISATDDVTGGGVDGPVAVASYHYWQRRLGASPNAIGQRVTLEGVPFTVVGVTSPEFLGVEVGRSFDLAVALASEPLVRGQDSLSSRPLDRWLMVLVRPKTGQSFEGATAAIRSVQPAIREAALPPADFARFRQDFLHEPFTVVAAGKGTSALQLRQRYTPPLVILLIVRGPGVADRLCQHRTSAARPRFRSSTRVQCSSCAGVVDMAPCATTPGRERSSGSRGYHRRRSIRRMGKSRTGGATVVVAQPR
jgi:hypothetical protein